jgi:DNA replication protein DnaC
MNQLGEAFALVKDERRSKPPFPDEFWNACPVCNWPDPDNSKDLIAWAIEYRPDALVDTDMGPQLSLHVSCKCVRDANAEHSKRLADCNLPWINDNVRRSLKLFNSREGTGEMTQAVEEFCRRESAPMLVLFGRKGCGKTHLLEAIGNAMLEQGASVRYERAEDLVQRIRNAMSINTDENVTELLAWYDTFDTVLIDDLGMVPTTDKGAGYMTAFVDTRYANGTRLAIATNLGPERVAEEYDERLADRMFNREDRVRTITTKAGSYRQEGK